MFDVSPWLDSIDTESTTKHEPFIYFMFAEIPKGKKRRKKQEEEEEEGVWGNSKRKKNSDEEEE